MVNCQFSVILVPQGAEYQAVCRGLSRVSAGRPIVQAIPVGVQPVVTFLNQLPPEFFRPQSSVLVLGLCGSLTPALAVGDVVLYHQCLSLTDPNLSPATSLDSGNLDGGVPLHPVVALTSDRVLWAAAEKVRLGQRYGAEVVDMEGSAILEALGQRRVAVTTVRVVSDDCHHDLPDLTQAVSPPRPTVA